MSAKSIQRKIDKAHLKVSKALGTPYALYRSITNVDVLDDANKVVDVKLTATINDGYTSTLGWQTPVWTVFTDAQHVQAGDFLWSEDEHRTFFVLSRLPHLPILAVEVNDRIDIKTVGYGDDGTGFSPTATVYLARNLPCFKSYGAASMSGGVPGRNMATTGFRTATIYTTLPKEKMVMGASVVSPDGFKGDITSYDYSSIGSGLKITVQEFVNPK